MLLAIVLYAVGFAGVIAGFPVDGLPGAGLALVGMAFIWAGWRRVVRPDRAELEDHR